LLFATHPHPSMRELTLEICPRYSIGPDLCKRKKDRGIWELRSFHFALCSVLRAALLYQSTYSARRTITEEVTYCLPLPSIIVVVTH
jgi:hypothetical protein